MTHKKVIEDIRNKFELELEAKTSFGRNELKFMFERIVSDYYISKADKAEKTNEIGSVLKKKVTTKTYSRALSGRSRKRV